MKFIEWITKPNARPPVLSGNERVIIQLQRTVSWRVWAILAGGLLFAIAIGATPVDADPADPDASASGQIMTAVSMFVIAAGVAILWARSEATKSAQWTLTNHRLLSQSRRRERSIDVRDIANVSRRREFFTWSLRIEFKDGQKPFRIERTRNGAAFAAKLLEQTRAHHEKKQDVHVTVNAPAALGSPVDPVAALQMRLVNGEISEAEYESKRQLLQRS